MPPTDFGTVSFPQAQVSTTLGDTGTITDPAFHTTEMDALAGRPGDWPPVSAACSGEANPSATTPSGTSFTVAYE